MAGLKPSANHSAFLDGNGPGDKLMTGLDNSNAREEVAAASRHKKKAAPTANLAKDLFANAYPSARDYIMRKQQLERPARAKAKAEAEANGGASGDGKGAGASAGGNKVQHGAKQGGYYCNNGASRKQQPGMSGRFSSNGASKRQQPSMSVNKAAPAQGVEASPCPVQAPASPPSLYDINEFPALK